MNTYNFYADFEQDIFILKSKPKITEGDNLSRIFAFEFAKPIEVGEAVILKIKNSNMENTKEVLLDFTGSSFEYALPIDILQVDGELTVSLTKTKGNTVQTIAEMPDGIRVRKALKAGELPSEDVSIMLQLIAKVTDLEIKVLSSMKFRGLWNSLTLYNVNDVVLHTAEAGGENTLFLCIKQTERDTSQPGINTAGNDYWKNISKDASNIYTSLHSYGNLDGYLMAAKEAKGGFNRVQTGIDVRVIRGNLHDSRGLTATDSDLTPIRTAVDDLNIRKAEEADLLAHETSLKAHKELFDLKTDKDNWRLIRRIDLSAPVTSITISKDDNGNPFALKEARLLGFNIQTNNTSTANVRIKINNTNSSNADNTVAFLSYASVVGAADATSNLNLIRMDKYWYARHLKFNHPSIIGQFSTSTENIPYNFGSKIDINTLFLTCTTGNMASGIIEFWGVDA